jgi:cholesterol 7-dehydrogenase
MTLELNDFIYFWYHVDEIGPTWFPESQNEVRSEKWRFRSSLQFNIFSPLQDFRENEADMSHLNFIHGDGVILGFTKALSRSPLLKLLDVTSYDHNGKWGVHPLKKHMSYSPVTTYFCVFGKRLFPIIKQHIIGEGPGTHHVLVKNHFFRFLLRISITPVGPMKVRLLMRIYSSPWMPTILCYLFSKIMEANAAKDIAVQNRRTFLSSPSLTKDDCGIKSFRLWYSQFYSRNNGPKGFPLSRTVRQNGRGLSC